MKNLKLFWVLAVVAVIFAVSIYISSEKIKKLETHNSDKIERVVVLDVPTPGPEASPADTPVFTPKDSNRGVPMTIPGCTVNSLFSKLKKDLGKVVNNRELRELKRDDFLKEINDFRLQTGLPLPVSVANAKLLLEGAVFNNCRSTCRGSVHEVFVSRIDGTKYIEILQKDETLKKIPLHEAGVEMASIDELNKKGVPFRSWLAPVSDSDWSIKGNFLYFSLDIEGLWLQIDTSSKWEVVMDPGGLTKLESVDEPLSVPGCNTDEQCLKGASRHFKAPRICQK
jgi:hypothetical protein